MDAPEGAGSPTPPPPLPEVHLFRQEGTLFLDDRLPESGGPQPAVAALTIVALPDPTPGRYSVRWILVGQTAPAAEALASFLMLNSPMKKIVEGMMEMMAAGGRIDGQPQSVPGPTGGGS